MKFDLDFWHTVIRIRFKFYVIVLLASDSNILWLKYWADNIRNPHHEQPIIVVIAIKNELNEYAKKAVLYVEK